MNKRIKIALSALTAAAVSVAAPALAEDRFEAGDAATIDQLPVTEAMIDAARSFTKVDMNKDGKIDADEYTSRRVVVAQLARFSRSVAIDGQEDLTLVLPEDVPVKLGQSERAALEAISRRDFKVRAFGAEGLDAAQWQESRLELFFEADRDGDGVLRDDELATYLKAMAGELTATFPST